MIVRSSLVLEIAKKSSKKVYTEHWNVLLQFSIQATIGSNYTGGIALDHVALSNGLCKDESEPQNNRQGINVTCTAFGNLFLCDVNVFSDEWIIFN